MARNFVKNLIVKRITVVRSKVIINTLVQTKVGRDVIISQKLAALLIYNILIVVVVITKGVNIIVIISYTVLVTNAVVVPITK